MGIKEYSSIQELLSILDLSVVKLTALPSGAKYFLYRKDPVKNVIILSSGVKSSIVDDIVTYFNNYDIDWYNKLQIGIKNKTFSKAVNLVKEYVAYVCEKCSLLINDPSQETIYKESGIKYFNIFQNTKFLIDKPNEERDWSVIHKILWNLCSEDPDKYNWVINWLTCLYNQPDFRFTTSIIFIGKPGTGKGMLTEVLRHIFDNTCYRANSRDLVSKFNSQLFEGKFLLLANEILDQNKKFQFSNDLKEYVSEKEISVEGKYMSRYIAKNFIKMIMFSNSKQPIVIEEDDRRYFVCSSRRKINKILTPQELEDFWGLDKSDFFKNQVSSFCAFLNNNIGYDYNEVISTPPVTTEKINIINMNKTDFKHVIEEIISDEPHHIEYDLTNNGWIKYSDLYLLYHNEDYSKYRKRELTKKKFSAKLSMEGFDIVKKTINNKNSYRVKVPQHIVDEIRSESELYKE